MYSVCASQHLLVASDCYRLRNLGSWPVMLASLVTRLSLKCVLKQLCRTNLIPTAVRKRVMLQYHEKTHFNCSVTIRGADLLAEVSDISLLQRIQSHWP